MDSDNDSLLIGTTQLQAFESLVQQHQPKTNQIALERRSDLISQFFQKNFRDFLSKFIRNEKLMKQRRKKLKTSPDRFAVEEENSEVFR